MPASAEQASSGVSWWKAALPPQQACLPNWTCLGLKELAVCGSSILASLMGTETSPYSMDSPFASRAASIK